MVVPHHHLKGLEAGHAEVARRMGGELSDHGLVALGRPLEVHAVVLLRPDPTEVCQSWWNLAGQDGGETWGWSGRGGSGGLCEEQGPRERQHDPETVLGAAELQHDSHPSWARPPEAILRSRNHPLS